MAFLRRRINPYCPHLLGGNERGPYKTQQTPETKSCRPESIHYMQSLRNSIAMKDEQKPYTQAPDKSKDIYFILSAIWIAGYFLLPSSKLHQQLFHLCFTLPGAWILLKNRFNTGLQPSGILVASLAYGGYYIISQTWTPPESEVDHLREIKQVVYLFLFWITLNYWMRGSLERIALLAKLLTAAVLVGMVAGAIQFYGMNGLGLADRFVSFGRLWNPLWSGAAYGAFAVLLFGLMNWNDTALGNKEKILYSLLFLIFASATILTHSRAPIGAMLIALAAIFLTSKISLKKKIALLATAFIVLLLPLYLAYDHFQTYLERGQSYRLDLWQGFLERAREHPIFGFGAGTRVFILAPGELIDGWTYYHSVYVGSLVELGITGLLMHLALCGSVIRTGWEHRHHLHARLALILFIYTMIIGITFGQGIITKQNVQWVLFWLPAIILASSPRSSQSGKAKLSG